MTDAVRRTELMFYETPPWKRYSARWRISPDVWEAIASVVPVDVMVFLRSQDGDWLFGLPVAQDGTLPPDTILLE